MIIFSQLLRNPAIATIKSECKTKAEKYVSFYAALLHTFMLGPIDGYLTTFCQGKTHFFTNVFSQIHFLNIKTNVFLKLFVNNIKCQIKVILLRVVPRVTTTCLLLPPF